MKDTHIIKLFFDRNENAIKETEKKYGRLCRNVARNILANDEDVIECENDTYLSLWNSIPPDKPANLTAFLCKVTRNIALKKYAYNNAAKRSHELTLSIHELEDALGYNNDLSEKELTEIINNFLDDLKQDERNVFIRRYFFFDSVKNIATRYSFSESKVKSMLFNTRNKLREYLKEEGYVI